jgi:hypothetical protein
LWPFLTIPISTIFMSVKILAPVCSALRPA